jgi:hypothetical protein
MFMFVGTSLRRLGGVVVSVLATGPKGCDKNPQHTFLSDGKESGKVPCRKILQHVKELLKSHRDE